VLEVAPGPSLNAERLARLYDPRYVRHIHAASQAPVQVCLDARMLDVEAGTGVATYAAVLARCLAQAGAEGAVLGDETKAGSAHRPRIARWIAALDQRTRQAEPTAEREDIFGSAWAADDIFREAQVFFNLHGRLLPVAWANPPQVMHWTYPVPLFVQGARNLYTIHDLIPLSNPNLTAIDEGRHGRLLGLIAEQAAALVTVSQTVRQAVIKHFGCAEGFVVNTYQAALAPLQRDPPLTGNLRPGRYFMFCGSVEPRKNLSALVEAHALSGVDLPLVITGPAIPGHEALEARLRAAPGVVRLPWQARPVLLGLLRRSRALLFPSLAEGFGLPIAEAMTLGAPVMTSNRGATAEIAGGAAHLVDPASVGDMAAAIGALAVNDALCAQLRAAGFARAQLFSPEAYGRRLRALYAGILADEPRDALS
jgi:glycosyltransferase involved in cell wall biosynthesis